MFFGMPITEREKVSEMIRRQITRRQYASGSRLPSERELAGQYSCSRVTVRSALEDLQREGVLARIPGKGTFVLDQPGGSAPVTASTGVMRLGFLLINASLQPSETRLLTGLSENLPSESWVVNFWKLELDQGVGPERYPELIHTCDAYVVAGNYTHADILWLSRTRKPLTVLGIAGDENLHEASTSYLQIYPDEYAAYMRATEFMFARGYERPAILVGSDHKAYKERIEGFYTAIARRGKNPKDFLCIKANASPSQAAAPVTPEQTRNAVDRLLDAHDQFDSVVTCSGWEVALGAKERGLRIPEDFALLAESSGEDRILRTMEISEIREDHYEIGKMAASRLDSRLGAGESISGRLVVPSELIVRRSCAPRSRDNVVTDEQQF